VVTSIHAVIVATPSPELRVKAKNRLHPKEG
jgi:hypothetical protein